jgi:hypothetical protein
MKWPAEWSDVPVEEPLIGEGVIVMVLLGVGVVLTLALIAFFAYVLTRKDE